MKALLSKHGPQHVSCGIVSSSRGARGSPNAYTNGCASSPREAAIRQCLYHLCKARNAEGAQVQFSLCLLAVTRNMDNSGKEKEAMALVAEADKKMKSSQSFFGAMFGGSSKTEEACDMYVRAANMYKMAKNWCAAGNAFSQAAHLHLQMQSKHDAATNFIDAGNAFKKADPQDMCLKSESADLTRVVQGRFTIAAKHHITIAEIYETEMVDIDKAIAHYEQAADYYKGEESTSSANKCLLKVATYAAQLEQYPKAIEIYEQVGTHAMDSTLLKYSAKDHFFKAALCHFCVDMLNAKLAVQKYEEMFPVFSDARECKLLKKLLDAYEEQNVEAYTDSVKEFDTISRLDQWLTTMLLRIKKTIQDDESDLR
ncbi:Alpha-soluble NSF attachment protein [Liparis tanakae]|uniref:Alpha-soluble NSF attachment protein n=1 Tax=Liparis tanakae TaxID=230148 RepID=A0A4Z2HNR8_9TELE|nr:Alpha-soluble NSF attachment protein [Liparis tanakae]